jgi:hypothetical protein
MLIGCPIATSTLAGHEALFRTEQRCVRRTVRSNARSLPSSGSCSSRSLSPHDRPVLLESSAHDVHPEDPPLTRKSSEHVFSVSLVRCPPDSFETGHLLELFGLPRFSFEFFW